ncbi:MAG TPA: serine protease [Geminicoccaceae bacterium]|nr:serine protease [Geminicoccaceae bacterium]
MALRVLFGLVAAVAVGACAAPAPAPEAPPAPRAAVPPQAPPIAWAEAPDCRTKLALLDEAARAGRLGPEERPPFAVVLPGASGSLDWLAPPSVRVTADLPLEVHEHRDAARLTAPCLLVIEPARDQRVGQRVVGRDLVRSLYQNGLRSERNPDYDAAQLRVRQAEREAKEDGPDILKVGDPMLDVFGLLIGGVLSGFSQGSRERELDAALSELAATPRSRDRPLYRPYEFEQTTVIAGKEATVPVALLDRASGRLWRAELRQRERRELLIIDGLDPRDRDYEQHSAASMTRHDFERWQRDPPQLQLTAIAAALLQAGSAPEQDAATVIASASPPDPNAAPYGARFEPLELEPLRAAPSRPSGARAGTDRGARPEIELSSLRDDGEREADDALAELIDEHAAGQDRTGMPRDLDAALTLWPEEDARRPAARPIARASAPAADPRSEGVVRLAAGARSGSGVYVRPDLVLTTAQMVDRASVVDVLTVDGARVLGLVARVDPVHDLALVQVARPGRPVVLHDGPPLAPGQPLEALALGADSSPNLFRGRYEGAGSAPGLAGPGFAGVVPVDAPPAPADRIAMPWFAGDVLIGVAGGAPLETSDGPIRVVGSSSILEFLYGSGGALAALP